MALRICTVKNNKGRPVRRGNETNIEGTQAASGAVVRPSGTPTADVLLGKKGTGVDASLVYCDSTAKSVDDSEGGVAANEK